MDRLDVAILWGLGLRYQPPYGHLNRRPRADVISASLGIDRKTVRSRIRKMEQSGLIRYYQIFPNLNLFGLKSSLFALMFPNPSAKREALNKLRLLESVPCIDEYVNSMALLLTYESQADLGKKVALVRELAGTELIALYDLEMPAIKSKLSLTDWLILRSLRYNALKPTVKVAEELGVTARGVNQRLRKLVDSNAFFSIPVFNMRGTKNSVVYVLAIFLDATNQQKAAQDANRIFGEGSFCQSMGSRGVLCFIRAAATVTEPEESYLRAKSIEGVDKVFVDLVLENHDLSEHVDTLIEKKVLEARRGMKLPKSPAIIPSLQPVRTK